MTEKIQKTLRDSAAMRWGALILLSALTFSTYWFQDFFGGVKDLLLDEYGFTSENFGRIISLTTFANLFGMIMLGGILMDKWGVRIAGLLFGGLSAAGGLVVYLASIGTFGDEPNTVLWSMIVGRMMFGSGLEVVCVVATRTIVKWFKGYELALAMAINMGFGRLGSAMGIAVSPDIASGHFSTAVGFAASLLGIALIMFVVYIFFDVKLDKQNKEAAEEGSEDEEFKIADLLKLLKNSTFIYITLLCVAFYAAVFPFIQYAADLLVNKFGFTSALPEGANIVVNGSPALGNSLVFVGLFLFAIAFSTIPPRLKTNSQAFIARIAIAGLFALYIGSMWDVFSQWLDNGPKTASLIPLGSIIFTPIFGSYVDKNGKAASLMILGSLLLIFAHLSLSVFNNVYLGYMGLLSLGIAFSLVPAAMWPSVAKIVPESRLGSAYSFMFTIQNYGLAAFFWGIGAVLDLVNPNVIKITEGFREKFEGMGLAKEEVVAKIDALKLSGEIPPFDYTIPILILVACGVISIFLSFKLKQADKKYGYGLEKASNN
ncbi:MFS transporter [Carboxylicivirga marina]|uniref:Lysosomal dipeptide transporter MFSD1 n=1 Tax=Carboxylicivirga marina TaxID=2800988 RepID=A0ABS1HJ90_9BACT|nr:MFS transporter [Carboxylicivirga marina]MBK3517743.1 MFS transporter [Carboxylicivirga marina]